MSVVYENLFSESGAENSKCAYFAVCENGNFRGFSPYLLERDQSYDKRRNANAAVHDCSVDALQDARVIGCQVHDAGQRSRRYRAAHDHGRDQADDDQHVVVSGKRQGQYEQPVNYVAEDARQFPDIRYGHDVHFD